MNDTMHSSATPPPTHPPTHPPTTHTPRFPGPVFAPSGRRGPGSEVFSQFRTELAGVDDRRLITFAVVQSLLRRVHEYPVRTTGSPLLAPRHLGVALGGAGGPGPEEEDAAVLRLCDGEHSLDEICCTLSRSHTEVTDLLRRRSDFVIVRR
jgi:hypothetical protein